MQIKMHIFCLKTCVYKKKAVLLQDSDVPKQASINAFYVIAFLRCRSGPDWSPILRRRAGRYLLFLSLVRPTNNHEFSS